ncbi:MAG TPA: hypothetical protein VFG86_23980 [Chloroflexota bacterium]|nr:hypothetical protein [Chloroflexota bacterium]
MPHPATVRRLAEALQLDEPGRAAFFAAARAAEAPHGVAYHTPSSLPAQAVR